LRYSCPRRHPWAVLSLTNINLVQNGTNWAVNPTEAEEERLASAPPREQFVARKPADRTQIEHCLSERPRVTDVTVVLAPGSSTVKFTIVQRVLLLGRRDGV
jgi:hypothetical protein